MPPLALIDDVCVGILRERLAKKWPGYYCLLGEAGTQSHDGIFDILMEFSHHTQGIMRSQVADG
jgi:hypothetical protein